MGDAVGVTVGPVVELVYRRTAGLGVSEAVGESVEDAASAPFAYGVAVGDTVGVTVGHKGGMLEGELAGVSIGVSEVRWVAQMSGRRLANPSKGLARERAVAP